MKYLNTKPGSIEELAANMSKHQNESGYQDMFKKELEKAGKGIGSMTPAEKKAFFNKIDDKYKAKNEDIKEEVSQKDVDKFHTKLDKLVHKSFGHSSDEKKKEVKEEDAYDKDDEKPKSKPKKETHTFMTKDMNQKQKDADGEKEIVKTNEADDKGDEINKMKLAKVEKGEKDIVDPEPKMKKESIQDAIKNVWQMSAEDMEKLQSEAKYMKAQSMNGYKAKGKADTGSPETKVDTEPKVDYKN
ncbi:hypothetical protein N9C63_00225 [bacterium]|nr:hypothetical protein [bacterium]